MSKGCRCWRLLHGVFFPPFLSGQIHQIKGGGISPKWGGFSKMKWSELHISRHFTFFSYSMVLSNITTRPKTNPFEPKNWRFGWMFLLFQGDIEPGNAYIREMDTSENDHPPHGPKTPLCLRKPIGKPVELNPSIMILLWESKGPTPQCHLRQEIRPY